MLLKRRKRQIKRQKQSKRRRRYVSSAISNPSDNATDDQAAKVRFHDGFDPMDRGLMTDHNKAIRKDEAKTSDSCSRSRAFRYRSQESSQAVREQVCDG